MAVTTAAVVGAAAAAKGAADSSSAAKKANRIQSEQNQESRNFIEQQAELARSESAELFKSAENNLLAGSQAAMDVFGKSDPQQMQAIMAGSDAARQAILGTGTGQLGFTPDMSFAQQTMPSLRPNDQRFGSASNQVQLEQQRIADQNAITLQNSQQQQVDQAPDIMSLINLIMEQERQAKEGSYSSDEGTAFHNKASGSSYSDLLKQITNTHAGNAKILSGKF